MIRLLQGLIFVYAGAISPYLGRNCRFHPTCSRYARDALERHGLVRGLCLACARLARCHPFHRGPAFDPVPGGPEDTTAAPH